MGKAFDRVHDAFLNQGLRVRAHGPDAFSAQAPGHSTADLSVSVKGLPGRVLVYSHSDDTRDVLDALGLTLTDLFDEPKGVEYEYSDGRRVHRSTDKRFRQSGNTKGTALFHVERLRPEHEHVFVVEGENDVLALESVGVVAVCTAMGAGKARLFDFTPLHGRHVRIVRDMDDPGLLHARQVREILAPHCPSVEIVEPAVGKDAADHITAGREVDEFVRAAVPEPVDEEFEARVAEEIVRVRSREEARARMEAEAARTVSAKLEPVPLRTILAREVEHDWIVPGLLERGDRLVLTGTEGTGKSYLLKQLSIALGSGLHPFAEGKDPEPQRVLVIDAENSEAQWQRTARYMATYGATRGTADPHDTITVSAGRRLDLTKRADVNEVHKHIDATNPTVLYIGPLYKLVPKGITSDDDAAPLIASLDSFRERGLVLLMEAHAGHGRTTGGDRDLRPRGSSALLGWPEFGMGLRGSDTGGRIVDVVRWRGDREKREWPDALRRGYGGEWPWMPAPPAPTEWR